MLKSSEKCRFAIARRRSSFQSPMFKRQARDRPDINAYRKRTPLCPTQQVRLQKALLSYWYSLTGPPDFSGRPVRPDHKDSAARLTNKRHLWAYSYRALPKKPLARNTTAESSV